MLVVFALSRIVSKINAFLHFKQNFNIATNNGRKMIFGQNGRSLRITGKKWQMTPDTVGIKKVVNIVLSHTISEILKI